MLNLSFVQECQDEVIDDVRESLDLMYIKNRTIMESVIENGLSSTECFMEANNIHVGSSKELDVFSFNNDHILKAIKFFNKAYKEIDFSETMFEKDKEIQEKGNINNKLVDIPKMLIKQVREKFTKKDGHFMKGFDELEKQFNCSFKVYTSTNIGTGTAILKFPEGTMHKITISKRDGFQLGGLPIMLNLNFEEILYIVPPNKKLFGATFTGYVLHEIYHNIVHAIDLRNRSLHSLIRSTFAGINSSTKRDTMRSKFDSLISKFKTGFAVKDREFNEEKTKNRFIVLANIKDNASAMRQFEQDIRHNKDRIDSEAELDEYIKSLKQVKSVLSVRKAARIISVSCAILLAGLGFVFGSSLAAASGLVYLAIMALSMLKKKVLSLFSASVGVQEEYFCDLFAAMYKLPIHVASYNRQIALNKVNRDKVREIRNTTNSIYDMANDPHPTSFDREMVSYQTAKQILASGTPLKKDIKRYLKYIVDLHEGMETMDAPHTKQQAMKLDPEAANDLRKTLNDFIDKSGVTVTESFTEEGEEDGS